MTSTMHYSSPFGTMLLAADEVGLTGAWFEQRSSRTQSDFCHRAVSPRHRL